MHHPSLVTLERDSAPRVLFAGDQLVEVDLPAGTRFSLLAPKVRAQKGEHRELLAELVQQGFMRARVDGQIIDLANPPPLDRYRRHDIEAVVDRLTVKEGVRARLAEALDLALTAGGGVAIVAISEGGEGTGNRDQGSGIRD